MNNKYVALAFLFTVILAGISVGQQVRIRSQITPVCGSGNQKFADIYADGNIAVLGTFSCRGAYIFDISNPDAPVLSSHYNPGANQQFLEAIVIGNRGYFGSGNGGGVHIVDLTNPALPTLLGTVNASNGNGHNSIHEMNVIDQNGKRFLIENSNTTSNKIIKIIDVTDPALPVFIRDLNPTEPGWVHAMHIRGNRMITSGFGFSQVGRTEIYDISNLATQAPQLLGFITDPGGAAAGNNMHSSWTSEDGNYLYSAREVAGAAANGPNAGDVRVYNITNPAVPLLVRKISMVELGLNAVTPHNPAVLGNKLYVSWYQAGVQVFDIGADPANPRRIGQYDTYEPQFAPTEAEKEFLSNAEPWDAICGTESVLNNVPTTYAGNWAVFPLLGENKVLAGDLANGLIVLDVTGLNSAPKNVVSDFDGDRKTDFSVYTPNAGSWSIESSSNGSPYSVSWGLANDVTVAADYDGDGKSDTAVWRPSNGRWYVVYSGGGFLETEWGLTGDVPVPGDYDADGRADIAVWRPSNGTWYIRQSTLGLKIQSWGLNGDKVVVGDYEGDGKTDLAVWRPSNGTWYVLQSSSSQLIIIQWGLDGDKPLVTDFDGNGRDEFTVFRPSNTTWYQLDIFSGSISTQTFGLAGDTPVPSDYDGDGKTDVAVFRSADNNWYRIDSSDNGFRVRTFGQTGDKPSPASVQPQ